MEGVEIGDIVYAHVQHAGCTFYHVFGKCVKILPSGRYRIRPVETKTVENRHAGYDIYTTVAPGEITDEKTFLIRSDGYLKDDSTWSGRWYKKYEDGTALENYYCAGD